MRRVRLALTNSCSGFGRPRSANTLPEPSVARGLVFFAFISVLPFSVIAFGIRQSLPDEIKVASRSGRAGLGLLLEGVQHRRHLEIALYRRPATYRQHGAQRFPSRC